MPKFSTLLFFDVFLYVQLFALLGLNKAIKTVSPAACVCSTISLFPAEPHVVHEGQKTERRRRVEGRDKK